MSIKRIMKNSQNVVVGLIVIVPLFFLAGCSEKNLPEQPEVSSQNDAKKVTSLSELVAGQVFLVTQKEVKNSFTLYPIGAPELDEGIDVPDGSTHVIINDLTGALTGSWGVQGILVESSDIEIMAVVDIKGSSFFPDPGLFDMIDIQDLFGAGWWGGMGEGCCVICMNRPNGSQWCVSHCGSACG